MDTAFICGLFIQLGLCILCILRIGQSFRLAWWRHQMETFSALLAICAGNSPVTGEFPAQRLVTRSFDVFLDLRLNKRWSKQWWGLWFEKPWCPLCRHCNGFTIYSLPSTGCDSYSRGTTSYIWSFLRSHLAFCNISATCTNSTYFGLLTMYYFVPCMSKCDDYPRVALLLAGVLLSVLDQHVLFSTGKCFKYTRHSLSKINNECPPFALFPLENLTKTEDIVFPMWICSPFDSNIQSTIVGFDNTLWGQQVDKN